MNTSARQPVPRTYPHRRRALAVAFLLAVAWNTHALLTNEIVGDWRGGVGITASNGLVSKWNDQHQLLNDDGLGPHNLTQTNAAAQPWSVSDAHGQPGILFPWSYDVPLPQAFLNIPATLGGFDTENTTVYAVTTGPVAPTNQTVIWFAGTSSGWMRFSPLPNTPPCLLVGTQSSTIYPPLNPAVFVAASDKLKTVYRWNNLESTNAPQTRITTTNGGSIGAGNGSEFYSGIIYRILVYKGVHTLAQRNAQVAELAALHGVPTNYTKKAVCRGASTSEGVGSTMLQSYPFQLWQRYPEIEWHNQGLGGPIGTNGELGTTLYTTDPTTVDPLYDGSLQKNWLFVLAGIDDIYYDGLSGHATWQRLTNYVAARKAAHPWTVVVSTIQSDGTEPLINGDFNACIRANGGPWDAFVDPGLNSPTESRLNNPGDTNYFYSDEIHLINAGYSVIAVHFAPIVNVPRRSTGSFWP